MLALLLTLAAAQGDVLLIAGSGEACPAEVLRGAPLVLRLDGDPVPARLAAFEVLELSTDERPDRADLARLRGASSLHLVGDDALSWWKAFEDRGKRSGLRTDYRQACEQYRGVAIRDARWADLCKRAH